MRRGFLWGVIAGVVPSVAAGLMIATLPTTPTWTVWRLKQALDTRDMDALRAVIDLPAVTANAFRDLGEDGSSGPDLGRMLGTVLSGGKLHTVFDYPHPLRLTMGDVVAAWWGMTRTSEGAQAHLNANGQDVTLLFGRGGDLRWRIVGIRPLGALVRTEPPSEGSRPLGAP